MTALSLISRTRHTGVTSTQEYAFTVPYLNEGHIEGYIEGVQDLALVVNAATVTFTDTVTTGDHLLIKRVTPRTLATQQVNFTNGAPAVENDFDTLQAQLLYLIQETQDDALESAANKEADANLTAGTRKIEDVVDGTSAQDAVTKVQLDNVQTTGGNLPSVTGSDNDKSIFVVAGAWASRTVVQARAILGLGTAALLDSGAAATELVPLDADAQVPLLNSQKPMVVIPLNGDFNMAGDTSGAGSTWLTSATGTNHRVDIAAEVTAFNDNADFVVSAASDNFLLVAGTYEFEVHVLFSNRHATNISQPEWAITNTNGTIEWVPPQTGHIIEPGSGTGGYSYAGSVYTNFITVGVASTMYLRMRNFGSVTSTWADRTGSFLKITRIK